MKKRATVVFILAAVSLPIFSLSVYAAKYTFIPRIDVGSYYTDNLDLTPDNEESAFVTSVAPGFTAGVSGRTAGIDLSFDTAYNQYSNDNDLNYWSYNAGLAGFIDINRNTKLTVTDNFYKTQDPNPQRNINAVRAGEPGAVVDPTVRQGQNSYWRNTGSARLNYEFGQDKSMYVEYVNSILRNNSDQYEDNDNNTGNAGLTYFFGTKWGTEINGFYTRSTYDQINDFEGIPSSDFNLWGGTLRLIRRFTRSTDGFFEYTYGNLHYTGENLISTQPGFGVPTIVVNEDSTIHDPRIGMNYQIDQDISLTVNAGWAFKINDVTDNQNGGVFEFVLRKTLQRGGVRGEAGAGYDIGDLTAQNLGISRYYRAGLTGDYEIFRRFYGDIYGAYRHNKYIDTIPERQDDVYLAGIGCTWQPYRWGSVRLGYSYNKVNSDIETNSYTENRIFLTISLSPELPYQSLY